MKKNIESCISLPRDVACFSVYSYENDNLSHMLKPMKQQKSIEGYQHHCVIMSQKFLVERNPPQS